MMAMEAVEDSFRYLRLDDVSKSEIAGSLLKKAMKENDISQSSLAKSFGYTRQSISQIVCGKVSINPRDMKRLFALVDEDIVFDYYDHDYVEYYQKFIFCLNEFLYSRFEDFENEVEPLLEDKYYYSFKTIPYQILKLIYLCQSKDKEAKSLIEDMDKYFFTSMNKEEKTIFCIIAGDYYEEADDLERSLDYLKKSLIFATKETRHFVAYAYLLMGIVYSRKYEIISSFECQYKAMSIFREYNNFYHNYYE